MATLNLATLSVDVQATGVNETQRDIANLTSTIDNTQGSTNSFGSAFTNLGTNMRDTIGQTQIFGTSLSSIGSAFTSAGGMATLMQGAVMGLTSALIQMATQAIQKAVQGLGQFINQGVELASDLDEIQNVLDSAFGDGAEQVNNWAVTTAKAFGLTEIQAKQYSSTLGAIFSGMNITGTQAMTMSEQMAQLTGDMASFYNLDHDVAFNKIKSGLTGETEPLKALGIVMNETNLSAFALSQGIETAYSKMAESDKVILRYNYLINQTNLAHGDFAKTQDSYANVSASMENNMSSLSATLGAQLLPVLTSFKVMFNDVLKIMSPVVEFIGKLIGGMLTTLANMISPVIEILKVVISVLNKILEPINKILSVVLDVLGKIGTGLSSMVSFFAEKMGLVEDGVAKTAKYTTEEIKEQTDEALGYVNDATTKWVDEQMDAYEATIRERFGDSGSLANEIKIQKMMETRQESLQRVVESTSKAIENSEKAKLEAINNTNDGIEKQISLAKRVSISSGGSYSNGVRQYATGTNYHTGGLAMVGEFGRELVNLPRGSQVSTNRQTENMMSGLGGNSGTTNTYHITIDASNVREFNDVIDMVSGYTQSSRMGGGR